MADRDGDELVAGRLVQPTLWRNEPRPAGGGPVVLDRRQERAAIDRVLDTVRGGFSGALVLRGGHGVGKTTLLEYAIDSAADLRISSVVGVESEINLEFGALHQLLVPCMSLLE